MVQWPKSCGQRGMLYNQNNNEASVGKGIVFSMPCHHIPLFLESTPSLVRKLLWKSNLCIVKPPLAVWTTDSPEQGLAVSLPGVWHVFSLHPSHPTCQSEASKENYHLLSGSLRNHTFCPWYWLTLSADHHTITSIRGFTSSAFGYLSSLSYSSGFHLAKRGGFILE